MPSLDADDLVLRCFTAGQAEFPQVTWNLEGFAGAVRNRFHADYLATLRLQPPHGRAWAEEFLIVALLAGRPGAAEIFDARYLRPLKSKLERYCPGAQVDDVLQVAREKLLLPPQTGLRSYENRGQLASWVAIVATRCALDVRRANATANRAALPLDDELIHGLMGPEQQYSSRQLQTALVEALRDAVRSLPQEQRLALRMQTLGNWNIDQIGRAFSTHRATAARWLVSAREQIEARAQARLQESFGLARSEVTQLFRQFRSQLDVRLSQLFSSRHFPVT